MILHCQICSIQGTHISEDSAIATIDEKKLKLPLTPEMFTSINPEREIPAPWMPGTDWQNMQCPKGRAHLPWGIDFTDIDQAIKDGGPKQLLTGEGMIDVRPEFNPAQQVFICDICGREIRSKLAFDNHYRACKRKHNA